VRYRELKRSDLNRTREIVRAWRDKHPTGTADQLAADVGPDFHRDWAPVLRATLFAEDRHRAKRTTAADDCAEALDDLRWHWGEAYLIHCLELGTWVAQRRDSRETLGAESPETLRDKIIADYARCKVPRSLPDGQSG
jgi:hypothetical protein